VFRPSTPPSVTETGSVSVLRGAPNLERWDSAWGPVSLRPVPFDLLLWRATLWGSIPPRQVMPNRRVSVPVALGKPVVIPRPGRSETISQGQDRP